MSRAGRIVSIDQLGSEIKKVFDEIESENVQDQLGQVAYEVVKEYRPKLKAEAKGKIKRKGKHVNNFVSVPKKDGAGFYGAVLWNKQYTLSHLVEDSHYLWQGGRTHNDYHYWKDIEPKMNEEFSKRCRKKIQELFK